jgi:K+-sensing histidine kinase KdpD
MNPSDSTAIMAGDLLELFSALLAAFEVEGQAVRSRFAPIALDEAVHKHSRGLSTGFDDAGQTVSLGTVPAKVEGERRLLQQWMANLLDHMLAHTPAGTHLAVDLSAESTAPCCALPTRSEMCRKATAMRNLRTTDTGTGTVLGLNMVTAIALVPFGTARVVPADTGLTIEIGIPMPGWPMLPAPAPEDLR